MRNRMHGLMRVAALLLLALAATAHAEGGSLPNGQERFFVTVQSFQDGRNSILNSHSFATFEKLTGRGPGLPPLVEKHTISWLPADFTATLSLDLSGPRRGRNLTLEQTLDAARRAGLQVKTQGTFAASRDLYEKALQQIRFLNSGAVDYKVISIFRRRRAFRGEAGGAINCIQAISDVIGNRPLRTGRDHGPEASQDIVQHFARNRKIDTSRSFPEVQSLVLQQMRTQSALATNRFGRRRITATH